MMYTFPKLQESLQQGKHYLSVKMGLILSKLHFVTTIREYLTGASAVEKMFDDTDPVRHIDIVFFYQ